MSRIHLKNNSIARGMIGLLTDSDKKSKIPVSYPLLHPTEGLNRAMLRELGRGSAIGCPASLPASEELQEYLKQYGIEIGKEPMLKRYARDLHADFNEQVVIPFNQMSKRDQRKCFSKRTVELLRGNVWNEVKAN